MKPDHDPAIDQVFPPEQAKALLSAFDALKGTEEATRSAEISELRGLLERVLHRLDQLAPEDEVPEEHLAVMGAVFAAYLGKRVRIRAARLAPPTSSWVQAGRAALHERQVRRH